MSQGTPYNHNPGYHGYQQAPPPYYQGQPQAPRSYVPPPQQPYPPGYYGAAQPMVTPLVVDEQEAWKQRVVLAFSDKMVRANFIRKVFGILFVMLAVLVGFIALFRFEKHCLQFVKENYWLTFVSYIVFFVVYIGIVCCRSFQRSFPLNFICLILLTISLSFVAAAVTAYYKTEIVLIAAGITAVCCLCVILFACQTKCDFTSWMGVLFVCSICLMIFGIIAIVYYAATNDNILFIVYSGIAALLFMIFLAVDVQLIVGGKSCELSPEDYIFASVMLFVDIVMIFLTLLQFIGGISGRSD